MIHSMGRVATLVALCLNFYACDDTGDTWITGSIPQSEQSEPPLFAEVDEEADEDYDANLLEGIGSVDENGDYSGFGSRAVISEGKELCLIDAELTGEARAPDPACPNCGTILDIQIREGYLEEDQGCDEYDLSVEGLMIESFRIGIAGDALYAFESGQWVLAGESWVDDESGEVEWVRVFD